MPNYYVMNGEDRETYEVVTLEDGRYRIVKPSGEQLIVDAFSPAKGRLHLLTEGGQSHDFAVRELEGDFTVQIKGVDTHVEVLNARQLRMRAAGVGGRGDLGPDLVCPMAGRVVALQVAEGDDVAEGDVVVIIEAMKMENDLKAHIAGKITSISVEAGQVVEIGDVLVSIEA